jgi:hypothetical protein
MLYAAAILAIVVSLIHSLLGEQRLIKPMVDGAEPGVSVLNSRLARRIVRFAWHITSVSWCAQAAIFVVAARVAPEAQARVIAALIGASFLLMAIVSFVISRGRHVGWPFLGATGLAGLAASFVW